MSDTNSYQVGDSIPLVFNVVDSDNDPVDSTVTLKIVKPSGEEITATPQHTSTGVYKYTLVLTSGGTWIWHWVSSGAVFNAEDGFVQVETGTWTWTGDPKNNPIDEIRFLIGDTDPEDKQVSNEEIEYALSMEPNAFLAAASLVDGLAASSSRSTSITVGPISIRSQDKVDGLVSLAKRLRERFSTQSGTAGSLPGIAALPAAYGGGTQPFATDDCDFVRFQGPYGSESLFD